VGRGRGDGGRLRGQRQVNLGGVGDIKVAELGGGESLGGLGGDPEGRGLVRGGDQAVVGERGARGLFNWARHGEAHEGEQENAENGANHWWGLRERGGFGLF